MLYPKEEARGLRIPRLLGKFKLGDVTEPGHSSSLAFHTKTKRPVRLRVRGVRAPLAECKQERYREKTVGGDSIEVEGRNAGESILSALLCHSTHIPLERGSRGGGMCDSPSICAEKGE